ncbi:hypothetical protein [Natroniella sulfidigena]|uniref:hypothetical protein n=1 Tax=Natroniella sulfidigena TaxID=723921 RepID=UPI00200B4283|nr:hypothetical protein [Natroniella sulfidigena]
MKSKKLLLIICFSLMFSFIIIEDALAHRMLIEEVGEDYVVVGFDDGTKAMEVDVVLYDQDEEVLLEGKTDLEGGFEFDPELQPYKIVSSDTYGHRAEWTSDEPITEERFPRWARALLGIGILLFIGVSANFISKKKDN